MVNFVLDFHHDIKKTWQANRNDKMSKQEVSLWEINLSYNIYLISSLILKYVCSIYPNTPSQSTVVTFMLY